MLKVVQCWDDGAVADIPLIAILRKYGARGSFNLNAASHNDTDDCATTYSLERRTHRIKKSLLQEVYEGFTIANHALTHPHLETLPEDKVRYEVRENRKILQDWFQQPIEGFVYPYGTYNELAMRVVEEEGHCYARTVKNALPTMPAEHPFAFHSTCKFNNPQFWEFYERAKTEGGVFYFWGHSFEMMNEEQWADFENKIRRISADPDAEWHELVSLFK